jgi:hypothetical protein
MYGNPFSPADIGHNLCSGIGPLFDKNKKATRWIAEAFCDVEGTSEKSNLSSDLLSIINSKNIVETF